MKSDVVDGLLNASWPVLVVEESGIIRNANMMAVQALDPTLANGSTPMGSIWPPDNQGSPAQFLADWELAPTAPVRLNLRGSGGAKVSFQIYICLLLEDGKKNYLLQL